MTEIKATDMMGSAFEVNPGGARSERIRIVSPDGKPLLGMTADDVLWLHKHHDELTVELARSQARCDRLQSRIARLMKALADDLTA